MVSFQFYIHRERAKTTLRGHLGFLIAPSRVCEYLKPLESRCCTARLEGKGFSFEALRLSRSYCESLRVFLLKFKERLFRIKRRS